MKKNCIGNMKKADKKSLKDRGGKALRNGAFGCLALFLAIGAAAGFKNNRNIKKEKLFNFVADEEENLRSAAKNAETGEFAGTIDGIDLSGIVDDENSFEIEKTEGGSIKFCCGKDNVFGKKHEWGFCYSPTDEPVIFPEEDDFYTEKICDNFWYYSVSR